MLKRTIMCGMAVAIIALAMPGKAEAAVGSPALGVAARIAAGATPIHWVCTPFNCTYIRNYPEPGAARPAVRRRSLTECKSVRSAKERRALGCP
jgi:hypothetical protein